MPNQQLVGFERVSLRAKETLSWLITVRAENMAVWNELRGFYIEPGKERNGFTDSMTVQLEQNL